jgi:hypothetical protein
MMSSYWGRQMVCGLQLDFDSLQASSDRILWCACGHAWGGLIRAPRGQGVERSNPLVRLRPRLGSADHLRQMRRLNFV